MVESNVIKSAIKRERGAFKIIYESCSPYVYAVVRRYIPDANEHKDVMQETFARVFLSIHTFDESKGDFPYEQALLSYHAQLSYTHRFGNGLALTMGLQYQQLETQLGWSKQLEVRGDVELGVEATRNVRHFNQYRLYQIPLSVGKSWRLWGKWHTGISIGGAVNIFAHNRGRNVLLGELENFDGPATPFLDSRWNLHGLATA